MASTQVQICNLALAAIGTRSTIASMTEQSKEASQCLLQWDQALDDALSLAHWNFARKQLAMAVVADAAQGQTVPTPWRFMYALPANCVQARFILPYDSAVPGGLPTHRLPTMPVHFITASSEDSQGNDIKVLLTNHPNAVLVYTGRILNPANWDSEFITAFYHVLGSRLAIPLTGDKATMRNEMQLANAELIKAQVSAGNEGLTVVDHMPDWIRVRGYESDWGHPDGFDAYGSGTLGTID